MAKKGKLAALNRAIAAAAAKAPREGFFSTLDELIQEAPFEKGSKDQWLGYLKPGRTLQREDVKFPLKKEELDYTDIGGALERAMADSPTAEKSLLLDHLRAGRPAFNSDVRGAYILKEPIDRELERRLELDPPGSATNGAGRMFNGPPKFAESPLSYQDRGVPGTYLEDVTISPDFGKYRSHFSPQDISWSRASQQNVDGVNNPENLDKWLHLIEEIQSDRHSDAADKILRLTPDLKNRIYRLGGIDPSSSRPTILYQLADEARKTSPIAEHRLKEIQSLTDEITNLPETRRGYNGSFQDDLKKWALQNSPPGEDLVDTYRRFEESTGRYPTEPSYVPDTPFKDPADYSRLEIKKQLLNALDNDSDYLGITTPKMQIDRYGGPGYDPTRDIGMQKTYGQIYPGELEKLARQYGIQTEDVPMTTRDEVSWQPEIMQETGSRTAPEFLESLRDFHEMSGDWTETKHHLFDVGEALLKAVRRTGRPGSEELIDQLRDVMANIQERDLVAGHKSGMYSEVHNVLEKAQNFVDDAQPSNVENIRSMKLTPEVKEKIKRIGVPLWSAVGAGAIGSQMQSPDETGYAEGGEVKQAFRYKNSPGNQSTSSKALRMLRDVAVSLGRDSAADKRKRLALGLASQLFGADENGDATLDYRPDVTKMLTNLATKGSTGYEGNVPGLVDSAISLGAVPAALASGVTGDEYRGPAISERAQGRVDALDSSLHRDYNLSPASTPGEIFDESLGMMLGQLPVKGPKVAEKFGQEAIDLGRKGMLSGLEFLSPTIVASPENYLIGAGFPTATATPEFQDAMQSEPVQGTLEALKRLIRKSEERKK